MVPRLHKFIQSAVDFAKKVKAALTWRLFGVYILFTLLLTVLIETLLYIFNPTDLPPFIIRLGSILGGILVAVLAGGLCK